ncbi:hypothetical protein [Segetibacter koreensis]|uniref:hypothetical protein n=1 Tax=Segetibacter koreensis TaxID=398037 RepID=UPI000382CB99|nr:hypothetical protein [Segetibacter koreensis]
MKGLEDQTFLVGYLISNAFALILLFFSVFFPKVARVLFFILFASASYINWKLSLQSPEDYVRTSEAALGIYRLFITGWFSKHVVLVVGSIATAQSFIAVSLLLKGWFYKAGVIGAIVFLVAIMPLGIASAFPSTLIMAYAMVWLLKEKPDYVWKKQTKSNKRFNIRKFTSHSLYQS